MSVVGSTERALRQERAESSLLAWAFVISVALHLLFFTTYRAGQKFGWWRKISAPSWLHQPKFLADLLHRKPQTQAPPEPIAVPLEFVNVSPEQATVEVPPNATKYSSLNSQAANPDPVVDTEKPKITGTQEHVPKTESVPREPIAMPLQPSAPQPLAKEQPEETRAKPAETSGDLVMAKPQPERQKEPGKDERTRPKTIAEAKLSQPHRPVGEAMKQEGGVKRRLEISSFDAKATPFGAYDEVLIEIIKNRWYSLLDQRDYASESHGKVVVQFSLHYDGRVTDMSVSENTAGNVLSFLCEKAVLDNSPYPKWNVDMRRMLGDVRNIIFTFYYN